nr:MAG TPA: hypothetical protein [Caudoviricetes sp.]
MQCQTIVVYNTEKYPVRCSIRNWAFFMSIGLHCRFIYELVEAYLRERIRLSFSHIICSSGLYNDSLATRD